MASLFSDYLAQLRVKHTADYSDKRFFTMPFQSLFGLTKLLGEYGVETQGLKATDKHAIKALTTPFLADTADGFAIVTHVGADQVQYISQGKAESAPYSDFILAWNGIALTAAPTPRSIEPGYEKHRAIEVMNVVKSVALKVLSAAMIVFLLAYTGIWHRWTSLLIAAIDIAGIYVSYMLVQKSLNIKNAKADAVCSVLQEGGCDTIAKSDASSFFGIVKWSEVGLAYFSVSLLALLVFPWASAPWLALVNACCLPYTVWSITYQKFVAKTWCTLCVTVQVALWALFFCYLLGGWWSEVGGRVLPLQWPLALLVACYAIALLAINMFDNGLQRLLHPNNNKINYATESTNGSSGSTADHI